MQHRYGHNGPTATTAIMIKIIRGNLAKLIDVEAITPIIVIRAIIVFTA